MFNRLTHPCSRSGSTKVFKTRPGRYLTAAPHQPKSGRPPNTTQPGPATDSSSPSKSLPTSDPPVGTHRTTTDSNDRPITSRETRQSLNVRVHSHSTCVLLPAPVTCFARARYSQSQKFALEDSSSSLIVLDWFTSGRMGMPTSGSHKGSEGEAWAFTRYKSTNEIWVQGQLQAKDVLLLEHEPPSRGQNGFGSGVGRESKLSDSSIPPPQPPAPPTSTSSSSSSSFVPRVAPYSAYATLLLVGPACAPVLNYLHEAFAQIEQPKLASPYALVWSFSKLPNSYVPPTTGSAFVGGDATGSGSGSGAGIGGVARCAGATTELVKEWVQDVLSRGGIEQIVSADMWKTAFG